MQLCCFHNVRRIWSSYEQWEMRNEQMQSSTMCDENKIKKKREGEEKGNLVVNTKG